LSFRTFDASTLEKLEKTEVNQAFDMLPMVSIPVLYVHGENSHFVSLSHIQAMARYTVKGEYLQLSGFGHFVPQESPEKVASSICHFIVRNYNHWLAQEGHDWTIKRVRQVDVENMAKFARI